MMTKKKHYETDDIVKIRPHNFELQDLHGKRGIICGISISEDDPNLVAYAVYMPAFKKTWFIFDKDLEDTGMKADPDFHETGFSVHIKVDPDTGRSEIIE